MSLPAEIVANPVDGVVDDGELEMGEVRRQPLGPPSGAESVTQEMAIAQQPQLTTGSAVEGTGKMLMRMGIVDAPSKPGVWAALGRYDLVKVLGAGGMGLVMLGRQPVTGRAVAIKLLRPECVADAHAVHRFLVEARHMAGLDHPHILPVLDVSDRASGPYYVMPYMKRGSLAAALRPGHPLDYGVTLRLARQVSSALAHAHGKGIIHRDLKPANVLLDDAGNAVLADFGLVRTFNTNDSLVDVRRDQREGTAAYMSPAVARGEAEDTRCDVYGLGAVLYELLTGHRPYEGTSASAVVQQVIAGPPQPILARNPGAPRPLVTVVEGCMARQLRDRYASVADVTAELERITAKQPPLGPHGRASRRIMGVKRVHGLRKQITAVCIGTVLCIAGAVVLVRQHGQWSEVPVPGLTKVAANPRGTENSVSRTRQVKTPATAAPQSSAPAPVAVPQRVRELAAGEVLQLAYGSNPPPGAVGVAPPHLQAGLLVRRSGDLRFSSIRDGEPLASERDDYLIAARAVTTGWLYIFQVDSTGHVDWLFPRNGACEYSTGLNPVPAGATLQVPSAESMKALTLDRTTGVEHVYFVYCAARWPALESALGRPATPVTSIARRGAGEQATSMAIVTQPNGLGLRGVGGQTAISARPDVNLAFTSPAGAASVARGGGVDAAASGDLLVIERHFRHVD